MNLTYASLICCGVSALLGVFRTGHDVAGFAEACPIVRSLPPLMCSVSWTGRQTSAVLVEAVILALAVSSVALGRHT